MSETGNVVRLQRDGPLVASGNLVVVTRTGARRLATAVLCRCGGTADTPFCDGSHVRRGFVDAACLPEPLPPAEPTAQDCAPSFEAPLTITPSPNGPLRCDGPFVIRDLCGTVEAPRLPKLCRCGASRTRPYCDGSHRDAGRGADRG